MSISFEEMNRMLQGQQSEEPKEEKNELTPEDMDVLLLGDGQAQQPQQPQEPQPAVEPQPENEPQPLLDDLKVPAHSTGPLHSEVVTTEMMADTPSYWDSVQWQLREDMGWMPGQDWKDKIINPAIYPFKVLGRVAQTGVGMGEVALAGVSTLAGAFSGTTGSLAYSFLQSQGPKEMMGMAAHLMPETVNAQMEAMMYEPRTEYGEAMLQMLGEAGSMIEGFSEWLGDSTQDAVLRRYAENPNSKITQDEVNQTSAIWATAARIFPEALLMMLPASRSRKATRQVVDVWNQTQRDKQISVFDIQKLERFPVGLTGKEVQRKASIAEELDGLRAKEIKTSNDYARIAEIEAELKALRQKEIVVESNDILTNMRPDEVMGLITDKQLETIDPKKVMAAIENKGEPIVIQHEMGKASVVSGVEEALLARALSMESVPVRYRENLMDDATVQRLSGQVDRVYDETRAAMERYEKMQKKSLLTIGAETMVDRQWQLKRRLIKEGGDAGRAAVMQAELVAGATPSAILNFRRFERSVYKGLSKDEEQWLNEIIDARRAIVVESSRKAKAEAKGKAYKPSRRKGGLQLPHYEAFLQRRKKELGEEKYNYLYGRAVQYFAAMDELLRFRFDEGLISKAEYEKLKGLDYRTTEYLEHVFEFREDRLGGRAMSIGESGIEKLKGGADSFVNLDSRQILHLNTLSVYRRVFENRANKSLAKLADEIPDNPLIRRIDEKKKRPDDAVVIDYMEDGKKVELVADPIFGKQWRAVDADMKRGLIDFVRWASGTPIVKEAAVGLNPEFFLVDFPRAVVHAYAASGKTAMGTPLYSKVPPMFLAEIGVDMAAVAKDALLKQGRYQDWVNGGGAPGFLAHLGGINVDRAPVKLRPLVHSLSWANEYAETLIRLGIRERALKKGASETEANHASRAYLDYARSGSVSHFVDQFVPFFNPTMQATETALRGLAKDPQRAAWLATTTMGVTGLAYLNNYFANPDAVNQITDLHMSGGLNFVMPGWETQDSEGRTLYPYIHIPMEGYMGGVIGMTNWLMAQALEGRKPSMTSIDVLNHLLPITPTGMIPPMGDVLLQQAFNLDSFTGDPVWRGPDIPRYMERYPDYQSNATMPAYRWLAETVQETTGFEGISPARTQASVESLLANHPFLAGAKLHMDALWGDTPKYIREMSNREFISRNPFFRRVVKLGNPTSTAFGQVDKISEAEAGRRFEQTEKVDKIMDDVRTGDITLDQALSTIAQIGTRGDLVGLGDRERLMKRAMTHHIVDSTFNRMKPEQLKLVPGRSWWLSTGQDDPVTRARIFYYHWEYVNQNARRTMESLARRLPGYWNPIFQTELDKLKRGEASLP